MGHRSQRLEISAEDLGHVNEDLNERISYAIEKHGPGKFINGFDILGILQLEFDEFKAEVQNRDVRRQRDELLDVATVALLAAASIGRVKLRKKTDGRPEPLPVSEEGR